MRGFKLESYHEYWELLKKDEKEQEKLLKDLTINVTEFFRDNPVYLAFKIDVLPTVIKEKKGKIRTKAVEGGRGARPSESWLPLVIDHSWAFAQ